MAPRATRVVRSARGSATTSGEVWRITAAGVPTKIAALGVHLEGLVTVPDKPARDGPLDGRAWIGAKKPGDLDAMRRDGSFDKCRLGVRVRHLDDVSIEEPFCGVNFGRSQLLGIEAKPRAPTRGDIRFTTPSVFGGTTGLFRRKGTGRSVAAKPIPLGAGSAPLGQWEHDTLAGAGIATIPPPQEGVSARPRRVACGRKRAPRRPRAGTACRGSCRRPNP